jgi:hypothetical protein
MDIAALEHKYYSGVDRLESTDPYSLGYVQPKQVEYVTAAPVNNLTFAR